MRCIGRLLALTGIGAVLSLTTSDSALASEIGSGDTVTVTSGEAGIDVVQPGGAGASGAPALGWLPATPLTPEEQAREAWLNEISARPPSPTMDRPLECAGRAAGPTAPDPALELALRLRSRLRISMAGIRTAPPLGKAAIVGIATWLWVERSGAEVLSATETQGPLTVTVSAIPSGVDWDTGDGHQLHCDGIGSPFVPGRSDPYQRPACSHAYAYRSTRTDPQGTYQLRASITYHVSWSANTGQGGPLDPATVTTMSPITVHELQAALD
jgi:hypothetical protein